MNQVKGDGKFMLSRLGEVLEIIFKFVCIVGVVLLLFSGYWIPVLVLLFIGGAVYSLLKYIFTGK